MATSSIRSNSIKANIVENMNVDCNAYAGTNTYTYIGRATKVGALGNAAGAIAG